MTLSSATEVVFDALDRAGCQPRGGADYFRARCPAHDSDSPSLGVKEGHEGRALLKCLVGCSVDSIVAALGLEMGDLFPPREPGRRYTPAPTRVHVRAQEPPRNPAEAFLQQLRVRFGADGYRATEDRRRWIGRCPTCEHDELVIVEDEHDPLFDADEPQVRFSCFSGCSNAEITARLEGDA